MNLSMTTPVAATATPPSSAAPMPAGEVAGADAFSNCLEDARATPAPAPQAAKAKAAATPARPKSAATDPALDAAAPQASAQLLPQTATIEGGLPPSPAPGEETPDSSPDLAALLPGWTPLAPTVPAAGAEVPEPQGSAPATDAARSAPAARALDALAHESPWRDAAPGHGDATAPAKPPMNARAEATPLPTDSARRPSAADGAPRAAPESAALVLPPALMPASMHLAPPAPAATASAALAPPPQHPDFAPALATQVRWWADAGVQQAQLTLNPPEMGPVAVRIVVTDAREARIDFSADVAATRQALEGSLPVLAAALDESGLKLTGGGVHDGASQRQGAWEHARTQSARHATSAAHEPARVNDRTPARTPAAARGIVDLVA